MPVPNRPQASSPTGPLDYRPRTVEPIRAAPEHPFVYRWSPEQWQLVQVDGQPVLIPELSKLILAPGVNQVHAVGAVRGGTGGTWTAEAVMADAIERSAAKGFRHLGPDIQVEAAYLPEGVEAGPLYRSTPVVGANGHGTRHHDCFEAHVHRNGAVVPVYHARGLFAWLAEMVRRGAFGTPPDHVVEALTAGLTAERDRKRALPLPADLREEQVGRVTERLEQLQQAADPKGAKRRKAEAVAHG